MAAAAQGDAPSRSTNINRSRSKKQQRLPDTLLTSDVATLGRSDRHLSSVPLHARVPWPAAAPLSDCRRLWAVDGARRIFAVRSQRLTCSGRKTRSPCRSAASTAWRNLLPCGHVVEAAGACRSASSAARRHATPANICDECGALGCGSRAQHCRRAPLSPPLLSPLLWQCSVHHAGRRLLCPATAHHLSRCETHCCTRCAALRCTRRRQASP